MNYEESRLREQFLVDISSAINIRPAIITDVIKYYSHVENRCVHISRGENGTMDENGKYGSYDWKTDLSVDSVRRCKIKSTRMRRESTRVNSFVSASAREESSGSRQSNPFFSALCFSAGNRDRKLGFQA